jgi:hypothetical protein
MKDQNWNLKEKRELFCKCVNSYIIKCGAEKDPIIEEVLKVCKKAIDYAFSYAPPEVEEQATEFNFPNAKGNKNDNKDDNI